MGWPKYAKGNCRKSTPRGKMNKLETEYAGILDLRRQAGEILWWMYEGIRFRIVTNDRGFYTPDFVLMLPDGSIEVHETKGFWESRDLFRIKIAAEKFPFRFVAIQKVKGVWEEREFGGPE